MPPGKESELTKTENADVSPKQTQAQSQDGKGHVATQHVDVSDGKHVISIQPRQNHEPDNEKGEKGTL